MALDDFPTWTVNHFTQSNPAGPGQDDVPALLRRVADSIEKCGPVRIADVVFHSEIDRDGVDWPSMTVYLTRADAG